MTMRSLGTTQRTSQGDQTTYYASDRRAEVCFGDQESDLQLEKLGDKQ